VTVDLPFASESCSTVGLCHYGLLDMVLENLPPDGLSRPPAGPG
jgi:hypothetical protein